MERMEARRAVGVRDEIGKVGGLRAPLDRLWAVSGCPSSLGILDSGAG